MGWKRINGHLYYYRSVRVGRRVRSEYIGRDETAAVIARLEEFERNHRESMRRVAQLDREDEAQEDRAIADWFDGVPVPDRSGALALSVPPRSRSLDSADRPLYLAFTDRPSGGGVGASIHRRAPALSGRRCRSDRMLWRINPTKRQPMDEPEDLWRGGKHIPEAVAPPIFPDHVTRKMFRVQSPFLKGYRLMRERDMRDRDRQVARRFTQPPPLYVKDEQKVGTLLPLTIDGRDILAVLEWHNNRNPLGNPGWDFWLPQTGHHTPEVRAHRLLGRWLVRFDTGWSWFYTFAAFTPGRIAAFTDIKNPPEKRGQGTWSLTDDGRSIRIVWPTSSEEWNFPLDQPTGVRGRSLMGQGGLLAKRAPKPA